MTVKGIEISGTIYDNEDETARNTAATASQTATEASQTATEASQTATEASQTATQASQTATQASQTATQASQTATQAGQMATQASQTATEADSKIGDLADLETTEKTDVVSAVNEVNGKIEQLNSLWSNPNPGSAMADISISLSISANAKGLLIKAGNISNSEYSVSEAKLYFASGKTAGIPISQSFVDSDSSEQFIFSRSFYLNNIHTRLDVGFGSRLTINTDDSTISVSREDSLIVPQEIYEIL